MTNPPVLTPLLALLESPFTSKVEYVVGGQTLSAIAREAAAQLLADDAMVIACGNSPVLNHWRTRRDGGPAQSGSRLKAVETYASIAFGSPEHPKNVDHVQGHVAELLWNRLLQERTVCRDGRRLMRAHSVKADPLEPGGDGLVVYKDPNGTLVFRLWEIKKHNSQSALSSTINRASKQLLERGHEYLAKLAAPETLDSTSDFVDLYADIVELWFDRSDRAGIGVSVGTSDLHAPKQSRSFGSMRRQFPAFVSPSQREGIVVALPDFTGFVDRVKDIVWSGL